MLGLLQAVLGAARAGEGIPALLDGLAEDLLLVLQRLLLRAKHRDGAHSQAGVNGNDSAHRGVCTRDLLERQTRAA